MIKKESKHKSLDGSLSGETGNIVRKLTYYIKDKVLCDGNKHITNADIISDELIAQWGIDPDGVVMHVRVNSEGIDYEITLYSGGYFDTTKKGE